MRIQMISFRARRPTTCHASIKPRHFLLRQGAVMRSLLFVSVCRYVCEQALTNAFTDVDQTW